MFFAVNNKSSTNTGGKKQDCRVCSSFSCLAHCQWLAYSAQNSCKVPPSPLLTNSCRSCPLRCAQTTHCFCLHSYACIFEEETRKKGKWKKKCVGGTVQLLEHMIQMIINTIGWLKHVKHSYPTSTV